MKTSITLLFVALAITFVKAQTIRRVNPDTKVTGTHVYNTIQAAHDAASNGDILIIEPGNSTLTNSSVGDLNCIKSLTIYGRGYFISQNPNYSLLQNKNYESTVGIVTFNASNCKIMGCTATEIVINGGVSGIKIERNYILGYAFSGTATPTAISIQAVSASISNITISQIWTGTSIIIYANWCPNSVSNVTISNSSFNDLETSNANIPCVSNIVVNQNNITNPYGSISYGTAYTNNIFIGGANVTTANSVNTTYNNNAGPSSAVFSSSIGANNIAVSNLSAQFNNNTSSQDNAYRITNGSVLLTAGTSGGQIGMFGGSTPYVQYGIPAAPAVIKIFNTGLGNATTPITATVSANSNN